ncbi:hypothetical protein [Gimesia sp.]|uniref:hypothetical protein n=1 Tax=Gimesia sp. TaxID=2024833 RepID=UPI0032EB4E7A
MSWSPELIESEKRFRDAFERAERILQKAIASKSPEERKEHNQRMQRLKLIWPR